MELQQHVDVCAGMVCAVRVVKDDQWMEGPYWLIRLCGQAFAAPSNLIHAGIEFEEGWLIVQAQYYKLEQTSERGYRLLPEKKYFVVNALIRLTGIEFCRTQGGPQQRDFRTTATGPAAAARKEGVGGLSFLSEDMNNILRQHVRQSLRSIMLDASRMFIHLRVSS